MNIVLRLISYFLIFYFINIIYAEKTINSQNNKNIVYLKIKGTGFQKVVSNRRGVQFPDLVYINEKKSKIFKNEKIYIETEDAYELKEGNILYNNIKLVWNYKLVGCDYLFYGMENITEIDFSEFDFSEVVSVSHMLYNCSNLKKVNFGQINTSSLGDMGYMFSYCYQLKEIDLSKFNTSNVRIMQSAFSHCRAITSLNVSNFDTSNVILLQHAFFGLESLTSIDISSFNLSRVYDMGGLFQNCNSLRYLNFNAFNTSKIVYMYNLFYNCYSLKSIDISINTSSAITLERMFYNCSSLISLDLSTFNTSNVQFMQSMFTGCRLLKSINLSGFDTENVIYMRNMFENCTSLISLNLSNFIFNQPDISFCFRNCISLTSIKFSPNYKIVDDIKHTFFNCSSLIFLDLSNFDFGLIKEMDNLFYGCISLVSLDLSYIDAFSLVTLESMFYGCYSLISLNLKGWTNSSSVINMDSMFYNCISLISLDLSYLDTSLVTNMKNLFHNCLKLTSINLINFQTTSVTIMESMFSGCTSLLSLNLSNFDTSQVTSMESMFFNCKKITSLDLSNFNTQNVTNMINMFNGCNSLSYLNFYNYNSQLLKYNYDIFFKTKNNLIICVSKEFYKESLLKELSKLNCPIFSCSKNYKEIKKKLIYNNDSCIDNCQFNTIYKYEYEDRCYKECPKGTHSSETNKYLCENNIKECLKKYPFLNLDDNSCIEYCNSIDFFNKKCILNNNSTNSKLIIISNILEEIELGLMDSLINEILNEKEDIIIKNKDTIYQITSSFNQKNKKYQNISLLKLEGCENILKSNYNLTIEEIFIIFKIEQYIEGFLIPLIEYEIFSPKTNKKLDLNICKNNLNKIELQMPVFINESILYKFDPNNDFYNDICNIYTTEYGTDITLYDRKEEYNKNNLSLCPNNCDYINYDSYNRTVMCECSAKNGIFLNENNLINHLKNRKSRFNLNVMKCPKVLFSKKGLIKNIGIYIILFIIVLFILSWIYFILKGHTLFYNQLDELLKKQIKERKIIAKKDSTDGEQSKEKSDEFISSHQKIINNINISNINNNTDIKLNLSGKIISGINVPKEILNKNNKKEIPEAKKEILYEEYEINNISYEKALEKDKRNYWQFYLSLLKVNHILIFTFNPQKDYNSYIIKISLFLFLFALYIFINTLFFNDSIMHEIYEDKGKFTFILVIPQIIYSIIICSIINIIISRIYLSQRYILKIKNGNNNSFNAKLIDLVRCLKIQFRLFFIINLLFLLLFWYYLSCFCIVYNNTQQYLFKVILISFLLSFIYPFIVYLIPGVFRIPALKGAGKCLYKISHIFQFL